LKKLTVLFLIVVASAFPVTALDINVTAQTGVGYSIVDIPLSTGWDEAYFDDWSNINIRLNAQGTWGLGNFRVGAELGYSWLYYYDVIVPPVPYYYWGYAGAFNISALGEYHIKKLALQAGAGIYIFSDGSAFGFSAAGTYRFDLNPKMSIPLTIRADVIFGTATIVPISIMTGFSYDFE
jgi:hypothetical protein